MNRISLVAAVFGFQLFAMGAFGQQSSAQPSTASSSTTVPTSNTTTVRGCLEGERGSYIVVEDKTSLVYVLKGVGSKLDNDLHHEVEVKGKMSPGTIKTGTNPSKVGSNPADTVHSVEGVPFQVADVQTDVRMISKHCKAADQE